MAQPFDPTLMSAIEKAVRSSDLGLNPTNDGKVVRIPIPPLTNERRKELSRHVHKLAEEGRNAVRQVRRDANDRLKKLLKDHKISEDDERRATRRGAEDHRPAREAHRRHAEEEGRGAAGHLASGLRGHRSCRHLSHLDCSASCGAGPFDPRAVHHLCSCGAPLLARYDLERRAPGRKSH